MAKAQNKPKTVTGWRAWSTRLVIFIVATGLITYGASSLFERHNAVNGPTPVIETEAVVVSDTNEPSEVKPVDDYTVAADMPRRIILPSLDTEGFIQQVGTTEDNAIAVPSNIHVAGWYVESEKPGEAGLSIIDGHVSGKYNDGVFKRLGKFRSGDQFSVEYGDLTTRNFEVVETKTLPEEESAAFLFERNDNINNQLNLITCGGPFDSQTDSYADRVIVVARGL